MKQIIVAKLKLITTSEQFVALRTTQLAYRDALNFVSAYAFEQGKISNVQKLQQGCYAVIRDTFNLPSQMACNVPRQVGATYKGLWTKVKQNAQHRKMGITKKRYKGLDKPPKYTSPTVTYNYGRDYGFKTDQRVSVLTLNGRIVVPYTGYNPHVALLQNSKTIGAAKLWYDAQKKQFYLLVSIEMSLPEPTPERLSALTGIDVGRRYLAVSGTIEGEATFFSGKESVHQADHWTRQRKRLQQKGTRAAKRRLRALSTRERRLKLNANHVVSKRIVEQHPNTLIGLEDLTHIRERTKPKKSKNASRKQRRANRHQSQWAFAELQSLIAYKAALNGSLAVKVDADYTSQQCPKCGHTTPDNRPNKGLLFVCCNCHYTLHADLVGARNVVLRTMLIRQDWMSAGQLSTVPDVSDGEAKAARLQRYAELRWSPDASLAF